MHMFFFCFIFVALLFPCTYFNESLKNVLLMLVLLCYWSLQLVTLSYAVAWSTAPCTPCSSADWTCFSSDTCRPCPGRSARSRRSARGPRDTQNTASGPNHVDLQAPIWDLKFYEQKIYLTQELKTSNVTKHRVASRRRWKIRKKCNSLNLHNIFFCCWVKLRM